jgi:hypothetical protein
MGILLGLMEKIKYKPSLHHCQKYYKIEYQQVNAILTKEKPAIHCFSTFLHRSNISPNTLHHYRAN